MLSLRIAWRFLRKSPGLTLLLITGIAVGIAVQVFVGSLITSLQADLVEQVVGSSPHVTLSAADEGELLVLDAVIEAALDDPRVTAVLPQRTESLLLDFGGKAVPLVITEGDREAIDSIYGLRDRIVEGTYLPGDGRIIIGVDLAEELGIRAGDRADLVQPDGTLDSVNIAGIFDLGNAQANESLAFLSGHRAAGAPGMDSDEYSAIDLQVEDVFASGEVADTLRSELPDVAVTDWQEENADLLQALASQSASSYLIQVFVIVAVALGIASTLAISAVQKTRQIGILKALGMADARTGAVFLLQGAMLGALGTAAGIGLALGLIAVFQQVTSGDAAIFPIEPQPTFIAISAAIGVGVAMASAIIPYRRTSRLDPIEVIQGG